MKHKICASFLLMILVVPACKQAGNKVQSEAFEEVETGFEQVEQLKQVYHRFPSPDEMLSFIQYEDLSYNPALVNDYKKSGEYLDSKTQAFNLGIYTADLAYLTVFEKHKEARNYFEAIYNISDKLRIASAFDLQFLKRVEKNLKNPDSLKVISDNAFTSITEYLVENDNEKIFAIISLGGFVETLYLAFSMGGDFNEENQIIQRISDQKLVVTNLYNYAAQFSREPSVQLALKEVASIKTIYDELDVVEVETVVSRDENGKLVIHGGKRIVMSEEQYLKLKDATFASRRKITQN